MQQNSDYQVVPPSGGNMSLSAAVIVEHDGKTKPCYLMSIPLANQSSGPYAGESGTLKSKRAHHSPSSAEAGMTDTDRYIDARLAGIEKSLDTRMDAMQRLQERSEDRFEKAAERHSAEVALLSQKTDQAFHDLHSLIDNSRKHSSNMAAVTIFGTVGGVLAGLALVVTLATGWITEQGGYSDMRLDQQQATQERAEFREAVQSIQQTQQSILERLPAQPQQEPPAQQ